MKTMHVLSLATMLALPLAIGCSDDETGGGSPAASSGNTGASGATGGTGGTGATGAEGGTGGTGAVGGSGGAGATGGTGGAGEGGTGGGTGGGGSAQAQAFCDSYSTTCQYGGEDKWASEGDCLTGYETASSDKKDCIEQHLGFADGPASVHCKHAAGWEVCDL